MQVVHILEQHQPLLRIQPRLANQPALRPVRLLRRSDLLHLLRLLLAITSSTKLAASIQKMYSSAISAQAVNRGISNGGSATNVTTDPTAAARCSIPSRVINIHPLNFCKLIRIDPVSPLAFSPHRIPPWKSLLFQSVAYGFSGHSHD